MQKYKDVISRVLNNKPIIYDENTNPNTQRHLDEITKIRKVNFKLQDDKAQLIQQLKGLRQSYLKYKNLKQSKDAQNKKLKSQLSKLKQKLTRTETLNNKLEKRLYSTKKSNAAPVTQRTQKAHSTKSSSNFSTELPTVKSSQYSVSIQTQSRQSYEIACQTDFNNEIVKKQQPKFIKQKFNHMIHSINLTESQKTSTYQTDKTSFRTSADGGNTQRHTGRIVSGKRKKIL